MSKVGKKHITSYATVVSHRDERLRRNNKSLIGIDIGSSSIKIVQMKKNKVSRWSMELLPQGMVNQGRVEAGLQLTQILKNALKKSKISGNQCSLCISGNEVIVRELNLPEMNDSQIMENIKHEITSFLPLSHEEYSIDYKVLEYIPTQDGVPGKIRIMVAAVPNEIVNTYIHTLKMSSLKVTYVDVMPNVAGKLAKWISFNRPIGSNNIGIIDFGASTTDIILLKDGNYFIHKTITSGGDYLTARIAEKLNIDMLEAEAFKRKANFFESNFQNNDCLFVKNIIDYIVTDIERTLEFYRNRNNQVGIDILYVMGGGSLLKGLTGYLMEHCNVEVAFLSDLLQPFQKNNDLADMVLVYPNAIGATLREG